MCDAPMLSVLSPLVNFNSQQWSALDAAGFIINDVQIPHMKGWYCGPDKRACVLAPLPVLPSCFLISASACITYSSPAVSVFLHTFSRAVYLKKSRAEKCQNASFLFFLPTGTAEALCVCSFWREETAFCLRSLCASNNGGFFLPSSVSS